MPGFLFYPINQFMGSFGGEYFMIVLTNIDFVGSFDQYITISLVKKPVYNIIGSRFRYPWSKSQSITLSVAVRIACSSCRN